MSAEARGWEGRGQEVGKGEGDEYGGEWRGGWAGRGRVVVGAVRAAIRH